MGNDNKMIDKIVGVENIFSDGNISYIIPLYQRAFAWGDDEIRQLIEDIQDFNGSHYYIGSLIVAKKSNEYEVIDGQQRLTALYLLIKELGIPNIKNCLNFECREKSNLTLKHLYDDNILEKDIEETIQNGKKIISDIIKGNKAIAKPFNKDQFIEQLKKVVLFRIQVPARTDLNRYFEIMNTRGEQLERHDIVKATLMSAIKAEKSQARFARIWDACRDMTGYVPMHFTNTQERTKLFGSSWNCFNGLGVIGGEERKNDSTLNILNIIEEKFSVDNGDGTIVIDKVTASKKVGRIRFDSIISFPFFLMHTLKVFISVKNIEHVNEGHKLAPELLDDKKLTEIFDDVINNGKIGGKAISNNKEQFSIDFIDCLLRCRWLFDSYIIKREYIDDDSDGEWSLKQLEVSGQKGNKKPYYVDTNFQTGRTQSKTLKERHDNILMLQAALRVSYTSPKVMHWITELLIWLYNGDNTWDNYEWEINGIVAKAVKSDFLDNGDFYLGVGTPHIVFNYLDYLLWRCNKAEYKDFIFAFRNSVEHWHPRNESKDSFEHWSKEDGIDSFGNLCLMQRNINSKFSNLNPKSKKGTYQETIKKGSIKLRIMSDKTGDGDGWTKEICKEHHEEMLKVLTNACEQAFK